MQSTQKCFMLIINLYRRYKTSMRFFTSQLEYDEIYYDTRTRLETICREKNDQALENSSKEYFIVATKVTMTQLSFACAISNDKMDRIQLNQQLRDYVLYLSEKAQCSQLKGQLSQMILKEVTLPAFNTAVKDNALARLFSEKSLFYDKLGLNIDKKCFKEYLLDNDYWDRQNTALDSGLLPEDEKKRILKGNKTDSTMIQPIHYVLFEEDTDVLQAMIKELLHYLCINGRVYNRRIVKIDEEDYYNLLFERTIQNLNNLNGGCVIALIKNNDSEQIIKEILKAINFEDNNYKETFSLIIVFPQETTKAMQQLKEYCPKQFFVKIANKKMNKKGAIADFKKRMEKDNIQKNDINWNLVLACKENYTTAEVWRLYRTWLRNDYSISQHFPQYQRVVQQYFQLEQTERNAREELQKLIGLQDIKILVDNIIHFFKVQNIRCTQNPNITKPTMHMVFSGNPGTAKTTVARLIGRILKEENILDVGNLYEVGRSDLVGKYVGWTAKTVKDYFEKAKGSVLFIDEAYSLADEQKSFGDEAINTIVQEMENHRNDVVVIMAGYKNDMKQLLKKNRGLESRIAFYIDFPDYTPEELYLILEKMVQQEGMQLNIDVHDIFINRLNKENIANGNGRIVRNILDAAKIKQAGRILSLSKKDQKKEMMQLHGEDFSS